MVRALFHDGHSLRGWGTGPRHDRPLLRRRVEGLQVSVELVGVLVLGDGGVDPVAEGDGDGGGVGVEAGGAGDAVVEGAGAGDDETGLTGGETGPVGDEVCAGEGCGFA